MAAVITTWEQAAQYDPTNPNQRTYAYYTGIPGGYSSFYYNKVPTTAQLLGMGYSPSTFSPGRGTHLLGVADPTTWPAWAQALGVAAIGAAAGFFGWKKFGTPIKRKLGLSGHRRRR